MSPDGIGKQKVVKGIILFMLEHNSKLNSRTRQGTQFSLVVAPSCTYDVSGYRF